MAPERKVHDFHPPIAPSGLYWVAVVPQGGLTVAPDGRAATLEMRGVPVIDQPRWPAQDADATPATIAFRVAWTATDERAEYTDPAKHFRFRGWRARVQLEASVEVPSLGFSWRSDPIETSSAAFGIIGEERNGRYFDP